MTPIDLPYGDTRLALRIPADRLGEVVRPAPVDPAPEPDKTIREALRQPIGTPRLAELVHPGRKVALIIDDISRPTPTHLMLPPVLACLTAAGIPRQDIRIVLALGTHHPMSAADIVQKTGAAIAGEFEIVNVPARERQSLRFLGTAEGAIPAWVNRVVAEADVRIGIGSITPHMDAGYSGGAKIVLPGVCGRETVDAFHARAVDVVGNQLGRVDTPLRVELERFVERHVGLDFILNAVLSGDGRLYKCVAGHFRQAHRVGVAYADEVYGVAVSGTYPVVFANAFPTDLDLWQATKAIGSGELITRDGGLLILVAACPRGTRDHAGFAAYLGQDPERLRSRLSRGAEQDPVGCALAILLGRIKRRIRLGVVSDGLGADVARQMGVRYFETAEAAVSAVLSEEDRQAKIAVVTHGGVTLPRLRPAGDNPQPGTARKPMEKG